MAKTRNGWAWTRTLLDLVAFALGLGTAWILQWRTSDLVWSLWLSSLVVGYLTILAYALGPMCFGIGAMARAGYPANRRVLAILVGAGFALFNLAFFSLHFCGFHAGHATFLSMIFPLPGVSERAFQDAFMNPFLLWRTVFRHLFIPYGTFLIPAVIAERRSILAMIPVIRSSVKRAVHERRDDPMKRLPKKKRKTAQSPLLRPYINVIRMHFLIFFFALAHAMQVDSFVVYAVVYFVYFFPWSELRKHPADPEAEAA